MNVKQIGHVSGEQCEGAKCPLISQAKRRGAGERCKEGKRGVKL